ncbi:MAG TPA: helix-turn-helix transcriptional regulator, partial [Acidimicrobiales bacterium]|nr:helix-turn-helix transcriptional regulator [Acidimicrobiales bacterium]
MFRRARDSREGVAPSAGMGLMADALEVSKATVSRWETGKSAPTDAHKVDIAEYVGVDVRAVFPLIRAAS